MKKNITALFLYLAYSICCSAQSFDQLDIRSFNDQQGLSYNDVRCFYKDNKGFLWIGTTDGLNRYDGNSIKIYRQHHGDKNSLPGDNTISIIGDDSTGLWIITFEGIVHFFPGNEKVIDYSIALCDGKKQSITGTLGKLFYDSNHTLCLINDYGISFFDKKQNVFVLHKIPHPLDSLQINRVTDYCIEDKNTLVLLGSNSLIRYNTTTHRQQHIKVSLDYFKSLNSPPLMSFIKNDDGKFWIATWGYGLVIIDEKKNIAESFLIDEKTTDHNFKNILFLIEKPTRGVFKNNIIIGAGAHGLYTIKPQEQYKFKGFEDIDNSNNLTDEKHTKNLQSCYCFYVDENNITFFGSGGAGVFSINPANQVFKKYNNQFRGVVSDIIKKETPSKEPRYYFSSFYTGGLHIFDSDMKMIKSYPHFPAGATIPRSTNVGSLYTDNKNQLWVGTDNGLFLYDELNDKFKSFLPDMQNPNSILNDRITAITQDHSGIFWIGLSVKGFQCFDADKNIFYNLKMQTPGNDRYVLDIIEDEENNIWLALDMGVVKINSARSGFIEYKFDVNDSTCISNSAVQCFFLDKEKQLWIGTKNGLNLYQPKTNTFKKYFRENGLCSDFIYSLAQDNNGNIWAGTSYGTSILNPVNNKITSYKNVSSTAVYCDANGKVIIGSGGGASNFVTCDENAIKPDSILPRPYITNMKITGEHKEFRNVTTLNLNDIKLSYKENYLTFDFTGVSFNDAYLNQFKCMLEGLETQWNETGKVRSISYAALAPGEYDFKLMCCNGDGIWNPKIASLHISIRPPWWQTWWFRLFLILIFASGAYYVYLQRIKSVRAEENIKTKLAQLETQALMAQMNPHFIFNALNSIQSCIVSNNNDAAYKYLNKFSILVRSILQNSREEFILLSNEMDILKNYLELEQLRFKDFDFSINISSDMNANNFKVPSSFMQPFVENSIIHGLAHKAGEKILEINITRNDGNLLFKINDNGIGRKKSAELNLKRTRSHTSMGMSIVESRLKLINEQYHANASLSINDLTDSGDNAIGTEVILILPLSIQEELF